jgi:hypothetical protein
MLIDAPILPKLILSSRGPDTGWQLPRAVPALLLTLVVTSSPSGSRNSSMRHPQHSAAPEGRNSCPRPPPPCTHRIYPSPLDLAPKIYSSLPHLTSSSFLFTLNPPPSREESSSQSSRFRCIHLQALFSAFLAKHFTLAHQQHIIPHLLFSAYTLLNRSTFFTSKLITQDAYRRVSRGPRGHRSLGSYCRSGN